MSHTTKLNKFKVKTMSIIISSFGPKSLKLTWKIMSLIKFQLVFSEVKDWEISKI